MKATPKKAVAQPKYFPYPKEKKYRGGCKVSWHYYETEAEALGCSAAAIHNANIDVGLGYDFGYCAPGEIKKMDPDAKYFEGRREGQDHWLEVGGLWEVCIP